MSGFSHDFEIIVIGGGHAGAEAAWTAANLDAKVALVTLDPAKIGAMSCNPAIGGLAKGQMVREIDALDGLMARAADATGIQFRVLNQSKGAAVQGPRCQSDKYRYAMAVQQLLATRKQITVYAGSCEDILIEDDQVRGITLHPVARPSSGRDKAGADGVEAVAWTSPYDRLEATGQVVYPQEPVTLRAGAVVVTTGTFMRGLMHTGERQTAGGRIGEGAAVGISATLARLGFELGRLKTGTPPRLAAETIDLASLQVQPGDDRPVPFSDMTNLSRFPELEQRDCHITATNPAVHELIRANLHRAPMYNGQIQTTGPRYCPSIEDKVVRFADRTSHHVFLEPESLSSNEIYCNGISTSLPAQVQEVIVHSLPGCERARILHYGYAVEYDMVWPHQIDATCMTKRQPGLFLAGQINGTSGYEEAAGQGLIAAVNAVRFVRGQEMVRLGRDQAYLGVMMDDLVTRTPVEPYRMFTSRAEHRLILRADNADRRLTSLGRDWGVVGQARWQVHRGRQLLEQAMRDRMMAIKVAGQPMIDWARRPEVDAAVLLDELDKACPDMAPDPCVSSPAGLTVRHQVAGVILSEVQYAGYIQRQQREIEKMARQESWALPASLDFDRVTGLGREARAALGKFRPATLGQAARLAGVTPADIMLLTVALGR